MFKPLPMQRITVLCLREEANVAALALAEAAVVHPEESTSLERDLPELPGRDYQRLYNMAQSRLDKILAHLKVDPDSFPPIPPRVVSEQELAEVNEQVGELWRQCSRIEEQERHLDEETKRVEQLSATLENFAALDIDLSLFQGKARFLDLHVGTVPAVNVERLREAVGLAGYYLSVFRQVGDDVHAVVAGSQGMGGDIASVLNAAGWRAVAIPAEFRGHPQRLRHELAARRQAVEQGRADLGREVEVRYGECGSRLGWVVQMLRLAAPYALLAEVVRARGGLTLMQGWAPRDQIGAVRAALAARLAGRFVLEARDPGPKERSRVPSVVRHPAWMRPFLSLVKNYGVPRYGEIDPTWLFALTYVLMFGMMFGDIGHGAVIAGAGLVLRRRLGEFAPFVAAVGVSSAFFGVLYGSIFGYEHLIPPLWLSPLSDPTLMLTLALYWGIGFILVATALTIRNRLEEGYVHEALFDSRGVAGIAFYLGLLYAGNGYMAHGRFGWLEGLAILLPLLVILAYKWHEAEFPAGERVLVVAIEGFEALMSYVANTLSFLRVAAFSLNHVALAAAIFTLANMMDTTGHWFAVVLGNLFILVLEGGIVAIQVLRLEYYEGFSRFFGGDGREFRPLTLK